MSSDREGERMMMENRRERLRQIARNTTVGENPELEKLSPEDLQVLAHEFGIYQIELETQNEELREARQELEETRDAYRELYEFAPVGYLTLDADGFIRKANLAGCRLLGLERIHLVGRELASLLDTESAGRLRGLLEAMKEGTVEAMEATLSRARPSQLRLEISTEGVDEGAWFKIVALDISEARTAQAALHRSEIRFRTLADTAPLGIFEADHLGRFGYVNKMWAKLTGLSAAQSRDFGWTAAVHPDDRKRVAGDWAGRTGEGPWRQEFRLQRPDGTEGWARLYSAPSKMRQGLPASFVGILEDITPMRKAQEDQKRARLAAEEANRAKSEFLANMSHEIRTPMTITLSALELLKDSGVRQEQEQFLKMADTASRSLLALINDILDFSKVEARKLDLQPQPCALREPLERTAGMFALQAEMKGIDLLLEIDPNLPEIVVVDPDRLQQVLTNLVGNALKFTEEGEIVLGAAPHHSEICIYVRDTGIGIPAEQMERLFQSFTQADGSLTRRHGGTGLGLAICRGLVELMGGKIWAESRQGDGSTFSFTLPFEQ